MQFRRQTTNNLYWWRCKHAGLCHLTWPQDIEINRSLGDVRMKFRLQCIMDFTPMIETLASCFTVCNPNPALAVTLFSLTSSNCVHCARLSLLLARASIIDHNLPIETSVLLRRSFFHLISLNRHSMCGAFEEHPYWFRICSSAKISCELEKTVLGWEKIMRITTRWIL